MNFHENALCFALFGQNFKTAKSQVFHQNDYSVSLYNCTRVYTFVRQMWGKIQIECLVRIAVL